MFQTIRQQKKLQANRIIPIYIKIILLAAMMLLPVSTAYAAGMKVQYDGKTITFTGQQAGVKIDGKSITMGSTPGLVINDYSMLPYDTVFQTGLGATCTYNVTKGTLTIQKDDIKIQMTVGKTTGYVNGKKVTLPIAPKKVKYVAAGKTKIVVPAQFVASKLGFGYSWINNSKTSLTIVMTSPLRLYYDGAWHVYTASQGKVTLDGTSVDVSNMPGAIIDNTALIQVKRVFGDSMGAEYTYNKEEKSITLIKGENTVYMTLGSNIAIVNGEEKTMDTIARTIKNGKTGKTYIMVPGRFVANSLGFDYTWNSSSKTSVITTKVPEKQSSVYFNLGQPEGSVTSDVNYNYITNVTAGYDAVEQKDYITLTTLNTISPTITVSDNAVCLDFPATVNNIGEQVQTLTNSTYLLSTTVTTTVDQHVMVTLYRNSGVSYNVNENNNQITLTFGSEKLKIAVDCGHGADTPGKRTPAMPVDIDFDGDGVIDVYAGESITEHQADVGVGVYLAAELERCGFEVYRSAFGDTDVPLTERQSNIKSAECDYSVSIHFNASGDGKTFNTGAGVETYYNSSSIEVGDGKALAQALQEQLVQGSVQKDRGIKSAALAMCKSNTMGTLASVLVECAFMTNENEAVNMMGSANYWKETAQDIARGICDYTGVPYIAE